MSRVCQGVCPRTMLLNILAGDTDSGTECTPSKLAGDTRVSAVFDTLQEGDAIQWDPNRLQRLGPHEPHEVQ